MRIISLDTETTGLLFYEGHRIVEVGCIEIIDGKITNNTFQQYVNPMRKMDPKAINITGLTDKFLADKPKFIEIIDDLLLFLNKSDAVIIHNARFDLGFINNELLLNNYKIKNITPLFNIIDTLSLSRQKSPGKKNNLDALCERYKVDNTKRTLHGALLDATLLAEIYLKIMAAEPDASLNKELTVNKKRHNISSHDVIKANKHELNKHTAYIKLLNKIDVK